MHRYLKPKKITPAVTVSQFLEVLAKKMTSEQFTASSHQNDIK